MNGPMFTISLDFELHWGGFEKWPIENYKQYFLNTREVIPEMLRLFKENEVHTTWATVGMLFHGTKKNLLHSKPVLTPTYKIPELSAYNFIEHTGIGNSEKDDPFHFAETLVEQITETSGQELGSHTFAHYYCNEAGQTVEQFRADLRAAQQSAARYGKKLNSLVFPRNQFNEEYLRVCYQEGFVAVRDNPADWFWKIRSTQRESKWKRLNRGLDAYLPMGKKNTYALESLQYREGLPVCIPASRLLRPYQPRELFLNDMKIFRVKQEMSRAAKNNEVYHLWWHPHNFGYYPAENLEGLKQILNHFSLCRQRYGMESLSMGEVAELVINRGIVS
jgi:peptidoglycan/xylan/chitin deacetylase (PgdA/CDA1 family)